MCVNYVRKYSSPETYTRQIVQEISFLVTKIILLRVNSPGQFKYILVQYITFVEMPKFNNYVLGFTNNYNNKKTFKNYYDEKFAIFTYIFLSPKFRRSIFFIFLFFIHYGFFFFIILHYFSISSENHTLCI